MLKNALTYVKDSLNQYFMNLFAVHEGKAVLANLVDQSGAIPLENQNKMVISLINLEQETAKAYHDQYTRVNDGSFKNANPAARFNLDILFTACFEDYEEGLKFLAATISFFQGFGSLNAANHADLPEGIHKLNFNIETLTYNETHSLWSAMGAKYQPSVIYKVRLISIQPEEIEGFDPSIQGISHNVAPRM